MKEIIGFKIKINEAIPSLNQVRRWQYKRWHWKFRKLDEKYRNQIITAFADFEDHILQTEKKHVQWKATGFRIVRITSIRKKLLDIDNLHGGAKTLIDVIKKLNLIIDDNPDHVKIEVHQCVRKDTGTVIEIQEG
jgi:Holliday junction resolvase RusA-like endonuclease